MVPRSTVLHLHAVCMQKCIHITTFSSLDFIEIIIIGINAVELIIRLELRK